MLSLETKKISLCRDCIMLYYSVVQSAHRLAIIGNEISLMNIWRVYWIKNASMEFFYTEAECAYELKIGLQNAQLYVWFDYFTCYFTVLEWKADSLSFSFTCFDCTEPWTILTIYHIPSTSIYNLYQDHDESFWLRVQPRRFFVKRSQKQG